MKHGVAFRKLSRPTDHRMLMLRNLVSSLIKYEQIDTTLAKAKETARIAEKIITLGKKGKDTHRSAAQSFLLGAGTVSKLFGALATRYAERPGGYTRILKMGNRVGDNAPRAVVELVDGPKDTKFEFTARKVGWEIMGLRNQGRHTKLYEGMEEHGVSEVSVSPSSKFLKKYTRSDLQKVFKYRPEEDQKTFGKKAADYLNRLLVEESAKEDSLKKQEDRFAEDRVLERSNYRNRDQQSDHWKAAWEKAAGQVSPGSRETSLGVARGAIKPRPWELPREETSDKKAKVTSELPQIASSSTRTRPGERRKTIRTDKLKISPYVKYSEKRYRYIKTIKTDNNGRGKINKEISFEEKATNWKGKKYSYVGRLATRQPRNPKKLAKLAKLARLPRQSTVPAPQAAAESHITTQ